MAGTSVRARASLAALAAFAAGLCFAGNPGLVDFGVAYYPEAWPESRWETDLSLMNELGIDMIRIGEFNWGNFEPKEGVFDFAPYLRLLDRCSAHGIKVMMCTPTAATPKWMQRDYPETEKTRADGSQPNSGGRQSSCPTSERFRFFSRRITERMAEAFRDHPAVTTWQLDNEISLVGATGFCVCERCRKGYIEYLKRRFGTVEEFNRAFNGAFWSGSISKWDDIRLPMHDTRCAWVTEYLRYQGEPVRDYILEQADILRRANPKWRITTNNPSASNWPRHDLIYRNLGYAATDTYISRGFDNDSSRLGAHMWTWSMFRGLTGVQKPFMVAETGPFCFDADLERGYEFVKPWFWISVAFGAESYVYFRWRESVNGEETHPAILPWSGRRGFVYDMIKRQMDEYKSLPESIARLPVDPGEVAIVHDAESHQYSLTYAYACKWKAPDFLTDVASGLLSALVRRGVKTDMVQMSEDMDLSRYKVVFFPQCYTVSGPVQWKIREYAAAGGAAVAVNRFNFMEPRGYNYYPEVCPVGLTDFFGIEIDERRSISYGNVELAKPTTAQTVRALEGTCFRGSPYITRNEVGKGSAWYVTQVPTGEMCRGLVADVLSCEGVAMREEMPAGVVRMERSGYVIVVNLLSTPQSVPAEAGELLLGSPAVSGGRMTVSSLDVLVYRMPPAARRTGP